MKKTKNTSDFSKPNNFIETNEPIFSIGSFADLPRNYKLINLLGEGAFSQVYKAWDKVSSKYVAIKIINKQNLTEKQLKNVDEEIKIMKQVDHPNLLKLLDNHQTKYNHFLILEHIHGGEIFNKIIEYTYFSESLSKHVFLQLLSSLEYLHLNNIVHRDIKPENLLFKTIPFKKSSKQILRKSDDETKKDEGEFIPNYGGGTIGVIKLADFGLAKKLPSSNNYLNTPCGTAGYTAPEIINVNEEGSPTNLNEMNFYNKSVDIWSLGCFLYTILCGFPPFYDDNTNNLSNKIINGDYKFLNPWWDEVSEEAKDLISRMLVTNPKKRITIQEIWDHPWIKSEKIIKILYFHKYRFYPVKDNEDTENLEDEEGGESEDSYEFVSNFANLSVTNQPLKSPMAKAIKLVFDNPAMYNHVHFKNAEPKYHKSLHIPRTPFKMDFKNVFSPNEEEDENEEAEMVDDEDYDSDSDVSSLTEFKVRSLTSSNFDELDVSSITNSDESECRTRSSSIISGMTGDFKFTLNLNDSNLLRRRSSVKSSNVPVEFNS